MRTASTSNTVGELLAERDEEIKTLKIRVEDMERQLGPQPVAVHIADPAGVPATVLPPVKGAL